MDFLIVFFFIACFDVRIISLLFLKSLVLVRKQRSHPFVRLLRALVIYCDVLEKIYILCNEGRRRFLGGE